PCSGLRDGCRGAQRQNEVIGRGVQRERVAEESRKTMLAAMSRSPGAELIGDVKCVAEFERAEVDVEGPRVQMETRIGVIAGLVERLEIILRLDVETGKLRIDEVEQLLAARHLYF